ncbi:MAG: prepilin-type N-terminal cleavage/methylation domain-containing protein [Eisenbergiella sp.]
MGGTVRCQAVYGKDTAAMEKKDRGFTLIELLIALAVLSEHSLSRLVSEG